MVACTLKLKLEEIVEKTKNMIGIQWQFLGQRENPFLVF